jgi:hypothetical protein
MPFIVILPQAGANPAGPARRRDRGGRAPRQRVTARSATVSSGVAAGGEHRPAPAGRILVRRLSILMNWV